MNLRNRLTEYVRACFTGIWIESHEHADALSEIATLCRDEQWQLATWDIEAGLVIPGQTESDTGSSDPLAAIRAINALATPEGTAILVLQNFHRFMQSAEVMQALARQIIAGKQNRTIVLILSPVVQIPVELEKMFVVIEHELPGREQLEEIARGIATEEGELPEGGTRCRLWLTTDSGSQGPERDGHVAASKPNDSSLTSILEQHHCLTMLPPQTRGEVVEVVEYKKEITSCSNVARSHVPPPDDGMPFTNSQVGCALVIAENGKGIDGMIRPKNVLMNPLRDQGSHLTLAHLPHFRIPLTETPDTQFALNSLRPIYWPTVYSVTWAPCETQHSWTHSWKLPHNF